jgi:SAM-dependent methyltransferase
VSDSAEHPTGAGDSDTDAEDSSPGSEESVPSAAVVTPMGGHEAVDTAGDTPEEPVEPDDADDPALQTTQMEALDRESLERKGQFDQLEQTLPLLSRRLAPDVVVRPPEVIVETWHKGLPGEGDEPTEAVEPEDEAARARAETPIQAEIPTPPPHAMSPAGGDSSPPVPKEPEEAREIERAVDQATGEGIEAPGLVEATTGDVEEEWVADAFGEEFLMTRAAGIDSRTAADVDFMVDSLEPVDGELVLDLACGWGRHAIELADRGMRVVGLDLSRPLLERALHDARDRDVAVKFIQGDMRNLDFEGVFDHCVFWDTSFGYFGEQTNLRVLQRIYRALKPGGHLLIDVANRDHVLQDMPHRIWWQGEECIFLEEGELDFRTSQLHVNRSYIFEDGRSPIEQDYYVRLYSAHELSGMLAQVGFEVKELSGGTHYPGYFLGVDSPRVILHAVK